MDNGQASVNIKPQK